MNDEKLNLLKKTNEKLNICDDLSVEKNRNIIFIYCPPKVGSTTMVSSIRFSACNKFTVLHVHNERMLKILCNVEDITIHEIINYNNLLGKNVFVIDIYRSPIEQKISQFFEKISTFHFNNSAENINKYDVNRIIKRFNNIFPYLSNEDYYKNVYNIPQLSFFDYKNKYIIQSINNVKYIKLRLKDSNDWGNIMTKILGTPIKIMNDYQTDNKEIKGMFHKFKEHYLIPNNLLTFVENCPSLKYYYSEEEREEYLNIWRAKKTNHFQYYNEEEYKLYNNICSENQYMTELQRTHYMDTGCTCVACNQKRKEIMVRMNNGEKITEKIIHNDAKNEFLAKRINSIPIIRIKKTVSVNKNKQKMQNAFKMINGTKMDIKF